jgi:DNA-binding LacI/PurR family transcriptional regulator
MLAPYALDVARMHPLAIDGAVIVDPAEEEALASTLFERGIPVVTTGRAPPGATIVPWVDNDHGAIARRMLQHLAANGYRRPALVATTPSRSYVADIVDAYQAWTRERDIPPTIVTLAEPPSERAAARAATRLLSRADRPDAVYATYDRLALGVQLRAQQLGIEVPTQLGVASAVDSDAMRWASPHITAAFLDARRLGAEAVRLIIDLIEGRQPESRTVTIPGRIIPRSSTLRGGGARGSRVARARRRV